MTIFCQYHCRRCGGHFTSLEAFDAHHDRETEDWCSFPDDGLELLAREGACRISDGTDKRPVTVYTAARQVQDYERLKAAVRAVPRRQKRVPDVA